MYTLCTIMAEGGFDPTDPTTEKTPLIPKGGDDDDDDNAADNPIFNADLSEHPIPDEEKEDWKQFASNTTGPQASSTPGGDHIQMATRLPPERQGASGDTETSFTTGFGRESPVTIHNIARKEVESEFPNASFTELDFRYKSAPKSGGKIIMVKYHNSDKEYPLYTQSRGDTERTLNTSLPKRIKDALGKSVTEEFNETNAQLQELQDQEAEQRKALQQAEERAAEAQRLHREMDAIRARITDISARRQQLEDAHGPLDKEVIQKLKDENRSLEADHQEIRKQRDAAAKAAKEAQKLQQDINKTRLSKGATERRLGELKAQKDAIQPTDKVKERIAELETKITEDNRIIADENTSSSEREAAQARVTANEAERTRLNEEIEVRERQRPLLERVKNIFKKYGWTLQAVALAVGIVLSALALAGMNGLKAGTKAVGQGLQAIGKKLGSLLPGLIGSIVSFIFKAAGQVFSFLAEHAWLLILAVVAFFMERLLKRKRR